MYTIQDYEKLNKSYKFIFNESIDKKNIVIFSNCQGAFIHNLLSSHSISSEYNIYMILCYLFIEELDYNKIIDIIKKADIFIYQYVYKTNDILSTYDTSSTIMKSLKNECKLISFTNIQNDSLYLHRHPELSSFVKKKNIKNIENDFSEFQIEISDKTNQILRNKDKLCDIKIVDYLDKHKYDHQLFIDKYHPTSFVLLEITNRILDLLKYKRIDMNITKNIMNYSGESSHSIIDKSFHNLNFVDKNELNIGNELLNSRIQDIWKNDNFNQDYINIIKPLENKLWN